MYSLSKHAAGAERAQLLAEMTAAVDRVLDVLPGLILVSRSRQELIELYARVENVRREVRSLRSAEIDEMALV
jgi:hypothetical protein